MNMKKEYSNGEITIVWEPSQCQHAGICVKMLPEVYKPKEKPWINQYNASTEQLKDQIAKCPSGALSYYTNPTDTGFDIYDNEDKKQYELKIDSRIAKIEYIKASGKIFLTHTEVPKELERRGLASRMVLFALEDIKENGLTLVPLCPFVAGYIKKHPEWRELVLKGVNIK
jgi:predicted GNAT family acetyltransferase/uncharacterized Fe-S cluster protein YjdI